MHSIMNFFKTRILPRFVDLVRCNTTYTVSAYITFLAFGLYYIVYQIFIER